MGWEGVLRDRCTGASSCAKPRRENEALDSGFAEATHFSHAFRDTFGVNFAPVFRKIERFERLV